MEYLDDYSDDSENENNIGKAYLPVVDLAPNVEINIYKPMF